MLLSLLEFSVYRAVFLFDCDWVCPQSESLFITMLKQTCLLWKLLLQVSRTIQFYDSWRIWRVSWGTISDWNIQSCRGFIKEQVVCLMLVCATQHGLFWSWTCGKGNSEKNKKKQSLNATLDYAAALSFHLPSDPTVLTQASVGVTH